MRKFLSKAVALLLIAAMAASAISCADKKNTEASNGDTAATSAAETEEITTEDTPEIERTDYEGEEFVTLYPKWALYTNYFFAEEQTGESMNDAIYARKMAVEEYLGAKLTDYPVAGIADVMPAVKSAVMGGSDDYQLALTHCIQDVGNMMTSGYLYRWDELPNIDMTKDYWNQNMTDSLAINGHSYYAVSKFMIADPNAILFNKQMVVDYSLEDPYELVRNGKWTLEKLSAVSKNVSEDVNGDGKFTVDDKYGFVAEADWMLNSIMYGCDQFTVKREEDGSYVLDVYNDKMLAIVDGVYDLLYSGDSGYTWPYGTELNKTVWIGTGRSLFQIMPINSSKSYRESDVDFGVLPYPKFSEAQESYLSNDWSGLMCMPNVIGDPEFCGAVSEMLAFYSKSTTMPAYYDVLLTGKFARDEETVEMLDIIYNNIVYDYGMNYCGFASGYMDLFYMIPNMIAKQKSSDLASYYAKYEKNAQKALDKIATDMAELEG